MIALALVAALAATSEARAQMFGDRALGRSASDRGRQDSSRRPSFAARQSAAAKQSSSGQTGTEGVGTVDLNARYVRGNRDTADFVGADSRDSGGFVGMRQAEATGEVESAVSDLSIESGPDANRTASASRPRARMYDPRLAVDFHFAPRPAETVNLELARRLESSLRLSGSSRIEVSWEGGKATLRGEVPSERERKLARLMLLLEPGVSDVQNDLIVKASGPGRSARPEDQP
ncbi:MAG: BON domain-containing protein [Planctomycetota bacterium]